MKMYQLNCPACGATVEIEQDRKSCYCSYCGSKIYMDDGVKRVEITKNINYHKTYTDEARIRESEAQERMQDKKYAADKEKWERKEKSKSKAALRSFLVVAIAVVVYLLVFGGYFGSEKRESEEQEKELQTIVEEVMVDIENGDFKSAHIKAETIYYTAGWSSEIEDKWDATRKELIKQIEDEEEKAEKAAKQEEKEKRKSEGKDTWWNPFD